MTYIIKLKNKKEVAKNTWQFAFEKPKGFKFEAGQYADITLNRRTRTFSLCSAPYEKEIKIAVRMRKSEFKRALKSLPIGGKVRMDEAIGLFSLPNNTLADEGRRGALPVVMMAGGIGVTPMLSILKQAAKDKLPHKIFLFYSDKTAQDMPFQEELRALRTANKNLKVIFTLTRTSGSNLGKLQHRGQTSNLKGGLTPTDWPDEHGRINI